MSRKEQNLNSMIPHNADAVYISGGYLTFKQLSSVFIGTAGNIAVEMNYGTHLLFQNIADCTILPLAIAKVLQTGTTTTNMIGIW